MKKLKKHKFIVFIVAELIALLMIVGGWGFVGCLELIITTFYYYYYRKRKRVIWTGIWLGIVGTEAIILLLFLRLQLIAIMI